MVVIFKSWKKIPTRSNGTYALHVPLFSFPQTAQEEQDFEAPPEPQQET